MIAASVVKKVATWILLSFRSSHLDRRRVVRLELLELRPVDLLQPRRPVRALLQLRRSAQDRVGRDLLQVGQRGQLVLIGELLGHDVDVLVGGLRGGQDLQVRADHLRQGRRDLFFGGGRGGLVEVEQQVAGVLRDDADRVVLQGLDVDLAGADVELGRGVDALGLHGLCVELGQDLVLGEVGRADHHTAAAADWRSHSRRSRPGGCRRHRTRPARRRPRSSRSRQVLGITLMVCSIVVGTAGQVPKAMRARRQPPPPSADADSGGGRPAIPDRRGGGPDTMARAATRTAPANIWG